MKNREKPFRTHDWNDEKPFRAHDWNFREGYVTQNKETKQVVMTTGEIRSRSLAAAKEKHVGSAETPKPQPVQQPIAQKTYPQRDDTASKVAALMRQGYSYSAAMDAALDGAPLNQQLYNAATKLNDTLGRIKNKAVSLLEGQKEEEESTDVA